MSSTKGLLRLVEIEILLTLLVILGGAFVRASGSGAGCGEHWPLCNGQAIPWNPKLETVIEFTHRLTSGLSLVVFAGIFLWLRRRAPADHAARAWARLALVSFVGEALIGAFLVLKKLVAADASILRAVVVAAHLVNTYLLLAGLAGVWWALRRNQAPRPAAFDVRARGVLALWCAVGAIGAVVALGDTLFPAQSLLHGLQQDLDSTAHFLVRLRIWHPAIAITAAALTLAVTYTSRATPSARAVRGLIALQLTCGFANWVLLAPHWLQLVHLLLADLTWLAVVGYFLGKADQNAMRPTIATDLAPLP